MALIDSNKKEINFKIVYYGPALSGKTTSIKQLQKLVGSKKKSKLKPHKQDERTLFFDFLALSSEKLGSYQTRFQVYTVPGQVLYEDSRKLLLKGVDGIIFVADSQIDKIQENLASFKELAGHLDNLGQSLDEVPLVVQFNKRDLDLVPPVDELTNLFKADDVLYFESVALKGEGVLDAFHACIKQILNSFSQRKQSEANAANPS